MMRKYLKGSSNIRFLFFIFTFSLSIVVFGFNPKISTNSAGEDKGREVNKSLDKLPSNRTYKDVLQRDTPRSSLRAFLKAARKGDLKSAVQFLDFSSSSIKINESEKEKYARELRVVIDRALWLDLSLINDSYQGDVNEESLPISQERVAQLFTNKGKKIDVLMHHFLLPSGLGVWKFASSTVHQIPDLYREYGYGSIGDKLSDIFPAYTFFYLELWQWVFLFILVIAVFVTVYIPTKIIAFFFKRSHFELGSQMARLTERSFRIFMLFLVARMFLNLMRPPAAIRAILQAQTLFLISAIWLCCALLGLVRDYFKIRLERNEKKTAAVLLQPATNIVRFFVIVVIIMVWFENIGLNATTVLTGFGIGGIAVALAAQKSIENLIGAVTLHVSAPVKLGDFGQFGNFIGTVEFIGLRYTKIRTRNRTLVNIPNAVFVDMSLESFTERDKIRFSPVLKISRETTADQIRKILADVKLLLEESDLVESGTHRIRFQEFGESSLDLKVVAYIKTKIYSEYLEVVEELNLKIMDAIQSSGTSLAVPARAVTLSK